MSTTWYSKNRDSVIARSGARYRANRRAILAYSKELQSTPEYKSKKRAYDNVFILQIFNQCGGLIT